MGFPNVPYKPVFGKLNLSVSSSKLEVTVGDKEEVEDHGPDTSSSINFKLPKGFSITDDPKEVTLTQRERVTAQHLSLLKKRETCSACKRATSEKMIEISQAVLDEICTSLGDLGVPVKATFSQDKTGALVSLFEVDKKTLGIKIMSSTVEVGYFIPNGMSTERKFRLDGFNIADHLAWLEV